MAHASLYQPVDEHRPGLGAPSQGNNSWFQTKFAMFIHGHCYALRPHASRASATSWPSAGASHGLPVNTAPELELAEGAWALAPAGLAGLGMGLDGALGGSGTTQ